jgi:hypothetical protein
MHKYYMHCSASQCPAYCTPQDRRNNTDSAVHLHGLHGFMASWQHAHGVTCQCVCDWAQGIPKVKLGNLGPPRPPCKL